MPDQVQNTPASLTMAPLPLSDSCILQFYKHAVSHVIISHIHNPTFFTLGQVAKSWQLRNRLMKSTHIRPSSQGPYPLHEAVHETVEFLNGHVLVCGCPSSIQIFVHTMRPRHIPSENLMPIVRRERDTHTQREREKEKTRGNRERKKCTRTDAQMRALMKQSLL